MFREVHVSMTGKVATATIMLALAATMLTAAGWPEVLYAIGLGTLAGRRHRSTRSARREG